MPQRREPEFVIPKDVRASLAVSSVMLGLVALYSVWIVGELCRTSAASGEAIPAGVTIPGGIAAWAVDGLRQISRYVLDYQQRRPPGEDRPLGGPQV